MQRLIFFLCTCFSFSIQGQIFKDNFSDGNFDQQPTWSGNTTLFIVNSDKQLQSQGRTASETIYLSTENTHAFDLSWSFWLQLGFSPSSSNAVKIYLLSNQADLTAELNGYYIGIGESGKRDGIDLFRQEGNKHTKIIDGPDGQAANANSPLHIHITRDRRGSWEVQADLSGGTNFTLVGNAQDNFIQSSAYWGIYCKHTTTRNNLFFFDNFIIDAIPDRLPPVLTNLSLLDSQNIQLHFDEALGGLSTTQTENYIFVNPDILPDTIYHSLNTTQYIRVRFPRPFQDKTTYNLSVHSIRDVHGNTMTDTQSVSFTYFAPDLKAPILATVTAIDYQTLLLDFSEKLLPDSALSTNHYVIDAGLQIIAAHFLSNDSTQILLTLSDSLQIGKQHKIEAKNISDFIGNIAESQKLSFSLYDIFPPSLETLEVGGKNLLRLYFSEPLDLSTAQNTAHYAVESTRPVAAITDLQNAQLVELIFTSAFKENKNLSLQVERLTDTLHNRMEMAITQTFIYDTKRPTIVSESLQVVSDTSLKLTFSEPLELFAATAINHYHITPDIAHPNKVVLDSTATGVCLYFSKNFTENQTYNIQVSNIADRVGNMINKTSRSFVFDLSPPVLVQVQDFPDTSLQLTFSEALLADSVARHGRYWLNETPFDADSVYFNQLYSERVRLFFSQALTDTTYTLSVSGLADLYGNVMQDKQRFSFSTKFPTIAQINTYDTNSLVVVFSKALDTFLIDTENFYTSGIGQPQKTAPYKGRATHISLTFAQRFSDEQTYLLTAKSIKDTQGNRSSSTSDTFQYRSFIEGVTVISDYALRLTFHHPLAYDLPTHLFSVEPSVGHPVQATLDKESPEILYLIFPTAFKHNISYRLFVDNLNLGDRVSPLESYTFLIDDKKPTIKEAYAIGLRHLLVVFSEPVGEISALSTNNYSLSEGLGVPSTTEMYGDTAVTLDWILPLDVQNNAYKLFVQRVEDISGNVLETQQVELKKVRFPQYADLVFSELLADPSPSRGLPEVEYLELYNRSNYDYRLTGVGLTDGSKVAVLGNYTFPAHTYLVLCEQSAVPLFQSYGQVLGLAIWPSLNNASDSIRLISQEGKLIDKLYYSDQWYSETSQRDGGYALEKISFERSCLVNESFLWDASLAPKGGTPGSPNTLQKNLKDTLAPQLLVLEIPDKYHIQLTFNESIDSLSARQASYTFSKATKISDIHLSENFSQITLVLSQALSDSYLYDLSVSGLADCHGNIDKIPLMIHFVLPVRALKEDILLSEILFNPPTGGVDFLELYNTSDKYIDLQGWQLANITDGTIGKGQSLSDSIFIFPPRSFRVLTSDPAVLQQFYPNTPDYALWNTTLPSFPDKAGGVVLSDSAAVVMQQFSYDESMQLSLLSNREGVSLERVNFEVAESDTDNWKSAAATQGYATPGRINSQYQRYEKALYPKGCIKLSTQIITPNQDGNHDYVSISLPCAGVNRLATIHIYDLRGQLVTELLPRTTITAQDFFTWDGTDEQGRQVLTGHYIIHAELFDTFGQIRHYKAKVVLSGRF